jgi:hypothetical protein
LLGSADDDRDSESLCYSNESGSQMKAGLSQTKRIRIRIAAAFGLLMLAALLPCTGCIYDGKPTFGNFWRFGPFLFLPGPFFTVTGALTVATGCTVFGIIRGDWWEFVGWSLLISFFLYCFILG